MKNFFNKILKGAKWAYNKLNGNKTTIGMGIVLIAQGMAAFAPDLASPEKLSVVENLGYIIGGVGLVHKGGKKAQQVNGMLKKISESARTKKNQ